VQDGKGINVGWCVGLCLCRKLLHAPQLLSVTLHKLFMLTTTYPNPKKKQFSLYYGELKFLDWKLRC